MNSGSEALEEGLQSILEPYLWEAVSGEEANVNWEEALYSSLMGFVSANITEGVDMAIDATAKVTNPTDTVRTQKTVTDSRNALMSPINNLDITAPEQLQSALTDQIKKAEPKMTSENMGQQSETVTAESNQTNVTVNPEAVAQSLMNKGFNPKTSAEIADAVAARLNGQELTKTQRNLLSSAIDSPAVQSVISDMQKTQTSRSDNVSSKPPTGNIGQLTENVQATNNQAEVAQSLRSKGISSKKADGIAEAITAILTGKELNRNQRNILRSALESPTVQSVVSEFMRKKADGIDSAPHNGYDEISTTGGDAITEASAPHQDQNTFSDGRYERGAEVPNNLKPQNLIDELASSGVKYDPDEVIAISKTPDGNLLWLEQGNTKSGLTHILERHADDFASQGVDDIPQLLNNVVKNTPVKTGSNSKGLFADYVLNGNTYRVAFGTNGYIVSFYPID